MSAAAVDAGALIDRGGWSLYQKLLTGLAALAVIFDGFDIQILGFAIPSLMKEWQMARSAFAPVLALGLVGMACGSPFAGQVGDRFGRRPALIGCVALFGLATIATAGVNSIVALAALRFLTGMGVGGALPNAAALAAELAPARTRHVAVKLTFICVPLGGMLGGVLAARVLPAYGWRTLYLIGGTLPLLFAGVLWRALPESPRFLVHHPARWPALAGFLARLGHSLPAGCAFEDGAERKTSSPGLRALFGPGLARDTAGIWVAFFSNLSGIYLVFGWLPAMLVSQGLDIATASTALAGYNLGGVLGVLVWAVLMSALGSRGPLLSGALATGGSALAILPIPVGTEAGSTLLLLGIALNGLLANAVQTSMFALCAHVYPTGVRATGVAYAAAIGRVGGIVSSLFGYALIGAGPRAYWSAVAVAMVCAFAGLAWVRSHFPAMRQAAG